MKSEKREFSLAGAMGWLLGLACALALGGIFYGAMAYQMLGAGQAGTEQVYAGSADALLTADDAHLLSEQTDQQEIGGEICTVTTRIYQTSTGAEFEAVTASPAAYVERLALEGWTPQLITGYVLAGMEAVCSQRGGQYMLSARAGDRIYMLRAEVDDRTLYTLGASLTLQ